MWAYAQVGNLTPEGRLTLSPPHHLLLTLELHFLSRSFRVTLHSRSNPPLSQAQFCFPRHLSWQMSKAAASSCLPPPPSPHAIISVSSLTGSSAWEILAIEESAVPEWGKIPGAEILATVFPRDQFCLSTRMLNHDPIIQQVPSARPIQNK